MKTNVELKGILMLCAIMGLSFYIIYYMCNIFKIVKWEPSS